MDGIWSCTSTPGASQARVGRLAHTQKLRHRIFAPHAQWSVQLSLCGWARTSVRIVAEFGVGPHHVLLGPNPHSAFQHTTLGHVLNRRELNQKHQSLPKQVESRSLDTHSTCCTQSESVNPFSVNVSANALQLKDDIRDVTAALHVLAVRRGNPLSAAARRDTVSWSLPPCSLSTAALGNTLLVSVACHRGPSSQSTPGRCFRSLGRA